MLFRSLQKFDKNLVLITRPKKSGLGSAHITAWRYAYENQFDQLITMDADLSHDATSINDISNMLLSCDFVIGTRFNLGKTEYKFVRKYLSVMANKLCRILLPSNLTEYTTSYRGFNLKTLEYLLQKEKWSENYSFFIEVIEYLNFSKLKLREVPINFRKRNSGKTKIPSNQIVLTMFKLLELFLNRKRNFTK